MVYILSTALHDLITQHFFQSILCDTLFDRQIKVLIRTRSKWYKTCSDGTLIIGSFYITMFSQIISVNRLQRTRIQAPVLKQILMLMSVPQCNIVKSTLCQFTGIQWYMLLISSMSHQNMKSSFVRFFPVIIQCFMNLPMFIAQSIYIDILIRNFNAGSIFFLKKGYILIPLKGPIKRIFPDVVIVSCHKKNSGIRNRGKKVIYLSQLTQKRLSVKEISGYK